MRRPAAGLVVWLVAVCAAVTGCGGDAPRPRPVWAPAPGTAWQWQLTTPVDLSVDVPVYDIDGFANSAGTVAALHRRGRHVICYVDVGSAERFRPDYRAFPASVIGKPNGWPGERWLDVRRIDVLGPIMARRFDMCAAKGFDAVEPDLVDGYENPTGFPITAADQLRYNRHIAALAHRRHLSVALKSDHRQAPALVRDFDFALSEECVRYGECRYLRPFARAGKAVLEVEYTLPRSRFCPVARAEGLSAMRKHRGLGAWRAPC